jgi:hypothetical protein
VIFKKIFFFSKLNKKKILFLFLKISKSKENLINKNNFHNNLEEKIVDNFFFSLIRNLFFLFKDFNINLI